MSEPADPALLSTVMRVSPDAIARDLALCDPLAHDEKNGWLCLLCGGGPASGNHDDANVMHWPACVWLRAKVLALHSLRREPEAAPPPEPKREACGHALRLGPEAHHGCAGYERAAAPVTRAEFDALALRVTAIEAAQAPHGRPLAGPQGRAPTSVSGWALGLGAPRDCQFCGEVLPRFPDGSLCYHDCKPSEEQLAAARGRLP